MLFNGFTTGTIAALLAGSQLAAAHMEVSDPAPFRSKFNPNSVNIDYTNTAPLDPSGANYPCKGYHSDIGTPAGKPTATYAPGGTYSFTIAGSARHGGGSCQVSLSYDGGKTFQVIKSIIGGCPLADSYDFTIPSDAPTGEAIWAWTWHNQIGNREQYMNCAAVTIGGGGAKREVAQIEAPKKEVEKRASFSSRPTIFLANIGNGCSTVEGTDVEYPNPGPDVVTNGGKLGQPVGNCGPAAAPGGDNGSGNDSGNDNGSGNDDNNNGSPAPEPTSQVVEAPAPTPTQPAADLPGGVFITVPGGSPNPDPTPSAEQPQPTTLVSATRPANPLPTGGAKPGHNPTGGYVQGLRCPVEGMWNCVGGDRFQRCASGTWTQVMDMAAGTSCVPGETRELQFSSPAMKRSARFRAAAVAARG